MASEAPGARRRGLLIDWGGVLTSNLFEAFNAFCAIEGLEPNLIGERFRSDRQARELVIGLETGAIAETEFERRFAAILGVEATELIRRLMAAAQPDETMLATVRRAHQAGIRTGLVSNSWGTSRYDRPLLAELFDGIVISGEIGLRKPAPEMYARGARAIDLPPPACVYVDDLPFNLEPAAELGMATVHHVSAGQTIPQLEELLGVALR
jgi:epoxide hydrolase-like predicted phosphatase